MKIGILLFVSYFLVLNVIPCVKQLESCETSCCSDLCEKSRQNDQELPEEDCAACNPLSSCDCCNVVFSSIYSFNFSRAFMHLAKRVNHSEFIPSITISAVWQPPKAA